VRSSVTSKQIDKWEIPEIISALKSINKRPYEENLVAGRGREGGEF
jgi:hypothetical protein